MDRRATVGLAMALFVVLAGCAGPVLDGASSPTAELTGTATTVSPSRTAGTTIGGTPTGPTGTPVANWSKVELRGGNFSFDAAAVYRRVARMHGMALSTLPDVTVYVRDRTTVELTRIYDPSGFERALGIVPAADNTAIAGLAAGTDIYIFEEVITDPVDREAILAHEFAHVVQHYLAARKEVSANVDGLATQRGRVVTGIIEGAASYVEHRYRVRFLGAEDDAISWRAARSGRSAFGAFLIAPYVFGQRYVARRVDSVEELPSIYASPPQTTEQLLHDRSPAAEPARPLSVALAAGAGDWAVTNRRTKGELFVRLVLEQQLSLAESKAAAAGWGNDRLLALAEPGGTTGYAWLLRWDDPGDADEFERAMRAYLDARGVREDGVWTVDGTTVRVVRAADGTVAVLLGDEAFVTNASVTGSGGEFTVDVDD